MIYDSSSAIVDVQATDYAVLTARFKELASVVDLLSAERKAINDEMKRREKEVAIKLRMGALSESDKVLYRGVLESPNFRKV